MKLKLKSALLLLNNVYFDSKKFTRATFADKLKENDLGFSPNKITELLDFIDKVFEIELTFKTSGGFVKIKNDEQSQFHFIKTLLLNAKLTKEKIKNENHIISFTSDSDLKNSETIFEIYEAILKTTKLKFAYTKFHTDIKTNYILKPLLLKEYLGRWYLIGEKDDKQIRVFGIERISNLIILNQTFEPNVEIIKLYQNTIGINFSEKVEIITLWVEDYQLKLFETTPIHPSQKIIERHANYGILTIEVSVNYELQQLLASFMYKVKVLQPESLKLQMIHIFETILNNYKN